jgi:hypothetical protein
MSIYISEENIDTVLYDFANEILEQAKACNSAKLYAICSILKTIAGSDSRLPEILEFCTSIAREQIELYNMAQNKK